MHLQDVLEDEQREPVAVLDGMPTHCLVALTAGFVKGEEQEVRRSPQVHDPSHGDVVGQKPKSRGRLFARTAEFVVMREAGLDADVRAKIQAAPQTMGEQA